jgi:hypothetical protein
MTKTKPLSEADERAIKEALDQLAAMAPSTDEEMALLEPSREDLDAMLDRMAKAKRSLAEKTAHFFLDKIGKVFGDLRDIVSVPVSPPAAAARFGYATRGGDEPAFRSADETKSATLRRKVADHVIQIESWLREGELQLEVDVLDAEKLMAGTEERAGTFKVSVEDANGKVLEEELTVEAEDMRPRYPRPGAGDYVFRFRFADQEAMVSYTQYGEEEEKPEKGNRDAW